MSVNCQANAIYFPEGAGYLLVKVLQLVIDPYIESDVALVKSLEDGKLYIRKTVSLNGLSESGIPNEIEFDPGFHLIPGSRDITKHQSSGCGWPGEAASAPFGIGAKRGEYYWTRYIEFCEGGDLQVLLNTYHTHERLAPKSLPEALIWKFIADMIQVLVFLRQQKICHKDIYPQNVFMRHNHDQPKDKLPDFLLGDFGWAVALDDTNRTVDQKLFCKQLLMLCGTGASGSDFERGFLDTTSPMYHLLSHDLLSMINDICEKALTFENDILDELVDVALPCANLKVDDYCPTDRRLCIPSPLCKSIAALQAGQAHTEWPSKIEGIYEDWQLVDIANSWDGSGKLNLHGLAKTKLDGSGNFFSFIRTTSLPVKLDEVYLFDPKGQQWPSSRLVPDGVFEGLTWNEASKTRWQYIVQTHWRHCEEEWSNANSEEDDDIQEHGVIIEADSIEVNQDDEISNIHGKHYCGGSCCSPEDVNLIFEHRDKRRKVNSDKPALQQGRMVDSAETISTNAVKQHIGDLVQDLSSLSTLTNEKFNDEVGFSRLGSEVDFVLPCIDYLEDTSEADLCLGFYSEEAAETDLSLDLSLSVPSESEPDSFQSPELTHQPIPDPVVQHTTTGLRGTPTVGAVQLADQTVFYPIWSSHSVQPITDRNEGLAPNDAGPRDVEMGPGMLSMPSPNKSTIHAVLFSLLTSLAVCVRSVSGGLERIFSRF